MRWKWGQLLWTISGMFLLFFPLTSPLAIQDPEYAMKRWRTDSSIYQILFHIPAPTSAHISNLRLHLMLSTAPIIDFHQTCHTVNQCNHPAPLLPCNHWDHDGPLMQMIIASIPKTTTSFILLLVPNFPISNPLSNGPKSLLLQHCSLIILAILYFSKIPLSPMPLSSLTPMTITMHGEKNV